MSDKVSARVRMYRHGLGDCFLLTFSRENQDDYHLLIDCGLFKGTPNGQNIMTRVAKDISDTTKKRLNAVALTHDHYDHTSGFSLAKNIFKDIKFEEAWVGWTEDENHPKYAEIHDRFRNILKGLRVALNSELKMASADLQDTVHSLINDFFAVGEEEEVEGTGFSKIWKYILTEKAGEVRCFRPGEFFDLSGDFGVRIYILGPPENLEMIEEEEPTSDESYRHSLRMGLANSFLAAATNEDNSIFNTKTYLPFDDYYKVKPEDTETNKFFKEFYEDAKGSWRKIDDVWLGTAGELALWMDDFTNNTCLAFAIELVEAKKVLIFPGDAQFGNWISWKDLSWKIPDGNGGFREIKAAELLARTVFYKVGHHGSHNATLRTSGLEMMNIPDRELVAMIPTNREFAKTRGKKNAAGIPSGWKMPEEKLMERLEQKAKGRVILADEAGKKGKETNPLKERCKKRKLSSAESKKFLDKVKFEKEFSLVRNPAISETPEPLYVEYTIEG